MVAAGPRAPRAQVSPKFTAIFAKTTPSLPPYNASSVSQFLFGSFKGRSTMEGTSAVQTEDFFSFLAANERSPEIPESHDIYGWLVGGWNLNVMHYAALDVSPLHIHGEAHFGWVL